jgi:hypothetical protein
MILIAHRGNLSGKEIDFENKPEYIDDAIEQGYNVEVDVRTHKGRLYLGHDEPRHEIKKEYLLNEKIWCHCKDLDAFYNLYQIGAHYFWHTSEDVVLTSRGIIWTFPRGRVLPGSVCVLPELGYDGVIEQCFGICSDDISEWKYLNLKNKEKKNETIRSSIGSHYDGSAEIFDGAERHRSGPKGNESSGRSR